MYFIYLVFAFCPPKWKKKSIWLLVIPPDCELLIGILILPDVYSLPDPIKQISEV